MVPRVNKIRPGPAWHYPPLYDTMSKQKTMEQISHTRNKKTHTQRRMNQARTEAASTREDTTAYFFMSRKIFLAMTGPMPVFQDLARESKLEAHEIDLKMAVSRKYMSKYCVSSHRWKKFFHPDADGEQMRSLQEEALKNPDLEWFWIDYPCMPQDAYWTRASTGSTSNLQ